MPLDGYEKVLVGLFGAALIFAYREPLIYAPVARGIGDQMGAEGIQQARQRIALEDTARFVDENMPSLQESWDKFALFKISLAAAKLKGLYCEFGVGDGTTVNYFSALVPGQTVHGFDSFEGLPESWREGFDRRSFAQPGLPAVNANVRLYKGWFDKTVPEFHAATSGPLAFAHMDADLYSSTKTVLDAMADRVVPGTVLQFDEFFGYPGWRQGEYKAFMEFTGSRHLRWTYLGYSAEQVAVRFE